MKVGLNLTPKMQGFGMNAGEGNVRRNINNGVRRVVDGMQQRVQEDAADYARINMELNSIIDGLRSGFITDRHKLPVFSEETKNDPRVSEEIKNKATEYEAYERGHVTSNRGQNEYLG